MPTVLDDSLFPDDVSEDAAIRDDPYWHARMVSFMLGELRHDLCGGPHSKAEIDAQLLKVLTWWVRFAGFEMPAPSSQLLAEFEGLFLKHDNLEHGKITSARELHLVPDRAALAAVRELMCERR